jgi:hypothetical protein
LGCLYHGTAVLLDAAQHLVLDLHEIVRIEESAVAEEGIRNSLRVRMSGALFVQGLPTALALTCTGCHVCLYTYVPFVEKRQGQDMADGCYQHSLLKYSHHLSV